MKALGNDGVDMAALQKGGIFQQDVVHREVGRETKRSRGHFRCLPAVRAKWCPENSVTSRPDAVKHSAEKSLCSFRSLFPDVRIESSQARRTLFARTLNPQFWSHSRGRFRATRRGCTR